MTMIDLVTVTGFVFLLIVGWLVLLLVIVGCVRCSNRVAHMVLDCYGGWKTFAKYREWLHENQRGIKE